MIGKTFAHFRSLRTPVRSLVYLYWISAFASSLVSIFLQIYLYQKFSSIPLNITATIVFYTGIMLGFCIPGVLAGIWRLNLKQGFVWSFVLSSLSLLYLHWVTDTTSAYAAMLLWGVGQGVFWLTVNTFELRETQDHERDLYSSALNAGNQILSLLGPACATLLIWISTSLEWGTFTLLFLVAPAVYLLGFFCFAAIEDYRPEPIRLTDIKHFFVDKKNQAAQIYTLGNGVQQILGISLPPLVLIYILGTPLKGGIYYTVFAIFSALCILIVAQYRTPKNRLKIYGITTALLVLANVALGSYFTLFGLIIYTIVTGIIFPIRNISSHVIDLSSMEMGKGDTDFYATMILRDFFLWVWRCIGGIFFLFVLSFADNDKAMLTTGLYLFAGSLALTYVGAHLFIKTKKRN